MQLHISYTLHRAQVTYHLNISISYDECYQASGVCDIRKGEHTDSRFPIYQLILDDHEGMKHT